jgi:hypothetical protein
MFHKSLFTCAFFALIVHTSHYSAQTLASPHPEQDSLEVKIAPINRADLELIPSEKLPTELRSELQTSPLLGSKNSSFDYVLVATRGLINGTSITLGYIFNFGAPIEWALMPGLLGATMSASLQIFHAKVSHWVKHKSKPKNIFDLRGFFTVRENEKASFVESFFIKQFSVNIIYLNALEFVSGLLQIQPELFSSRPFLSAALSLPSEGFWVVANAQLTERMVTQFPHRAKLIWHLSKVGAVFISGLSTFGSVMFLMKKAWAPYVSVSMGALGAMIFVLTTDLAFRNYGRIRQGCASALQSLGFKDGKLPVREPR